MKNNNKKSDGKIWQNNWIYNGCDLIKLVLK